MLAIFRTMVCLIKCTILDISPGYSQTKCVTLIGIMVHEVTIFQERQTMASVKEIFQLMGQKEINIKKCKFWLLSKFFILKSKYYFFRRILTLFDEQNLQMTSQ